MINEDITEIIERIKESKKQKIAGNIITISINDIDKLLNLVKKQDKEIEKLKGGKNV